MNKKADHTVSFLEMNADPKRPKHDFDVRVACPLPPAFFRAMYCEVGRKWQWDDLLQESDADFNAYCNHPNKRMFTLIHNGAPAGFFVLDQQDTAVELAYFGLLEDVIGEGLGSKWLDYAICVAWDTPHCKKMTVNTCTLDHPRALALYLSRGFEIIRKEERSASG